jgi:hypothetical protein
MGYVTDMLRGTTSAQTVADIVEGISEFRRVHSAGLCLSTTHAASAISTALSVDVLECNRKYDTYTRYPPEVSRSQVRRLTREPLQETA